MIQLFRVKVNRVRGSWIVSWHCACMLCSVCL